jgi:hypothetical protein
MMKTIQLVIGYKKHALLRNEKRSDIERNNKHICMRYFNSLREQKCRDNQCDLSGITINPISLLETFRP